VQLAALDDGPVSQDVHERFSQTLAAVNDAQDRPVDAKPSGQETLKQVRAEDGVFCRSQAQAQDVLFSIRRNAHRHDGRAGTGVETVEVQDDRPQVRKRPAQLRLHPGLGGCHEATGDGALGSPRRLHAAGRHIQRPLVAASADVRENLLDHPLGQDIAALEASHARQRHLTPVLRPDPLHV
jgi:hypothetical protein